MSFASPVAIAHFRFPFSIDINTGVAAVEQGSVAEIQSNVLMIASCGLGECAELPSFGIPDPTFQAAPPSSDLIAAAIEQLEPRADPQIVTSILDDWSSWQMAINATVVNTGGGEDGLIFAPVPFGATPPTPPPLPPPGPPSPGTTLLTATTSLEATTMLVAGGLQ